METVKTRFLMIIALLRQILPAGVRTDLKAQAIVISCISATCALVFTACDHPFETKASRKFLITAGEHYSSPRLFETFTKDKLAFRATFDASAKYDLGDRSLQSNINKLMGFSDCNSIHHENSARFGWKWENGNLEIYAYCYVDSVRTHEYVGTVQVNEENLYEIAATGSEYVFSLNGERKVGIKRTPECDEGAKYMLYPYFGGSAPAPHDVTVAIEVVP